MKKSIFVLSLMLLMFATAALADQGPNCIACGQGLKQCCKP